MARMKAKYPDEWEAFYAEERLARGLSRKPGDKTREQYEAAIKKAEEQAARAKEALAALDSDRQLVRAR